MRSIGILSGIAAILLMLASCGGGANGVTRIPEGLLKSMPSDAAMVARFSNAEEGLACLLDSSSAFRRLDIGQLGSAEMAFCYNYASGLVPLLALDASSFRADSSASSIVARAAETGLKAALSSVDGRRVLLLSPSAAVLAESVSHISEGTSILAAPNFAAASSVASRNCVIVRNSSVLHLIAKDAGFLAFEPRRAVGAFLSEFSDWMVFNLRGDGSFIIEPVCPNRAEYYFNFLDSLEDAESRIGDILPKSAKWVVDIPVNDLRSFRDAREVFLDAHNRVQPSRHILPAGLKEVAKIIFEEGEVIAVRQSSKSSRNEVPEDLQGLLEAVRDMFGSSFCISAKSPLAAKRLDEWMIIGTAEAADAFLDCGKDVPDNWPEGEFKAVIYCHPDNSEQHHAAIAVSKGNIIEFERA